MGKRKITIQEPVVYSIAEVAWFIESKGLVATAEKYADAIYDFIESMADDKRVYNICREPTRSTLGFKCINFNKKYTIVFIESSTEIIICEFIPSKLIYW